jgi:hypothetical protein
LPSAANGVSPVGKVPGLAVAGAPSQERIRGQLLALRASGKGAALRPEINHQPIGGNNTEFNDSAQQRKRRAVAALYVAGLQMFTFMRILECYQRFFWARSINLITVMGDV